MIVVSSSGSGFTQEVVELRYVRFARLESKQVSRADGSDSAMVTERIS
jgi:hypothetical protein